MRRIPGGRLWVYIMTQPMLLLSLIGAASRAFPVEVTGGPTRPGAAFAAANAVDGDFGTYWSAEAAADQWELTIDLGDAGLVPSVSVCYLDAWYVPDNATVALSQNGKSWEVEGDLPREPLAVKPVGKRARYIRLTLQSAAPGTPPAIREAWIGDTRTAPDELPPVVQTATLAYTSSVDGTGPLHADAYWPAGPPRSLPLVVVMHGLSEPRTVFRPTGPVFAEWGLFVLAVDMRGRTDSAGQQDLGRIEVHDIYDAVQCALAEYPQWIDSGNLNLWGWSGGGGNAFSAITKFPDLFRQVCSGFGISDYGVFQKDNPRYRDIVHGWLGGEPEEVPARYYVSASRNAVKNVCCARIHLFWDSEETVCRPWHNRDWIARAQALGQSNVAAHESAPQDRRRWIHGHPMPDTDNMYACRHILLPEVLEGRVPAPKLPDRGELEVLGYVVTKPFTIFLGRGDRSAARVAYSLSGDQYTFALTKTIAEGTPTARITVAPQAGHGAPSAEVDGQDWPVEGVQGKTVIENLPLDCTLTVTFPIAGTSG